MSSIKGYENGKRHSILIFYLDLTKDCCKLLLKIVNYFFTELTTSADTLESLFCGLITFLIKLMAKFLSVALVEGKTLVLFTLILKINRKFTWWSLEEDQALTVFGAQKFYCINFLTNCGCPALFQKVPHTLQECMLNKDHCFWSQQK